MRDHNKAFCSLVAETFDCPGPVFEFGSYQVDGQEGYANLRGLFATKSYVGCDMRPGPGVDRVEDVTAISLPDESAGTVLCIETFEHVFDGEQGIRRSLSPAQTGRHFRHHVSAQFPDPRLPGRLLADDAQLPAAPLVAVRRAGHRLSGLSCLSAHGHGGWAQGTGRRSTARRRLERLVAGVSHLARSEPRRVCRSAKSFGGGRR